MSASQVLERPGARRGNTCTTRILIGSGRLCKLPLCFLLNSMDSKLAQISSLPQKDKGPAYVATVNEVLSRTDLSIIAADVHIIVETVLQDNVVVGRQVLQELARALGENHIQDLELKKRIVEDTLSLVQPRLVSYEEQVGIKYRCEARTYLYTHRSTA